MTGFPYVWTWQWRTLDYPGVTARVPWFGDGVDRAGMRCRVVVRDQGGKDPDGRKRMAGSAVVEFADGSRFVTSRGGLRRADPGAADAPAASRPAPAGTRQRESG